MMAFYKLLFITGIFTITYWLFPFRHINKAVVKNAAAARPQKSAEAGLPAESSGTFDSVLFNELELHLVHQKTTKDWPVLSAYPLEGAILPFKRIVAYYGNFYSSGMGILAQLPADSMLAHLMKEARQWKGADSILPVQPALEYIAVTAQGSKGNDGKYRDRMPFSQIEKTIALASKVDAIVILDVQVGLSSLQAELPLLKRFLQLPNVHLAIDPEYSMKTKQKPGSVIGSFDADDVNYASAYLAALVTASDIPPKLLIVHRFTVKMVSDYRTIALRREVQIIMDMDGFGFPKRKTDTYKRCISDEPVQFAGFKLFYKKDIIFKGHKTMMTPAEVLDLYPSPVYIQYQ